MPYVVLTGIAALGVVLFVQRKNPKTKPPERKPFAIDTRDGEPIGI